MVMLRRLTMTIQGWTLQQPPQHPNNVIITRTSPKTINPIATPKSRSVILKFVARSMSPYPEDCSEDSRLWRTPLMRSSRIEDPNRINNPPAKNTSPRTCEKQ